MNNAEELLQQLGEVVKRFNILQMTNYLGCDQSIYNVWKKRKVLPYRNVRKIVEYLEMHNDDVVDLCGKLMEYCKEEEKKRNERVLATQERNRERSRARYQSKKK